MRICFIVNPAAGRSKAMATWKRVDRSPAPWGALMYALLSAPAMVRNWFGRPSKRALTGLPSSVVTDRSTRLAMGWSTRRRP